MNPERGRALVPGAPAPAMKKRQHWPVRRKARLPMADQTPAERALTQALADSQSVREELTKRVEHNGNIARQAQQECERLKQLIDQRDGTIKAIAEAPSEDEALKLVEKLREHRKPAGAQVVELPPRPPALPSAPGTQP